MRIKAQISFLFKLILIVLSSIILIFTFFTFYNYLSKFSQQRESAEFRISALNLLQKLVSDPNCLAYSKENSSLPIIDKEKLDYFVQQYKDVEPDCAKALDFDYSIEVIQFRQSIKTYPGEILKEGECAPYNGLAFHATDPNYLVVCDKDLSQEDVRKSCCGGWEQDIQLPNNLVCRGSVSVYCKAYDCSQYMGSQEKCESIDESTSEKICCVTQTCSAAHPKLVVCYNINPEKECKEIRTFINGYCGDVGVKRKISIGENISIAIAASSWRFSINSGISSFSPQAAIEDQIELTLPIVIRYNDTYSTNGEIHLKAVKGQLESFYSRLEDICQAAKKGQTKRVLEKFVFRFPIVRDNNKICMLDSCKIFDCPFSLDFNTLEKGEHILKIYFDQKDRKIVVEE